jgi:serine/threonine protein kinase/predicted negative regulator of RcsB-dependent stress response
MENDRRVQELLTRWEEGHRRGQPLTPEELCADTPELLPEVRRRCATILPPPPPEPGGTTTLPTLPPSSPDPGDHPESLGASGVRYSRLAVLAEGGMGRVFSAHDEELSRPLAVKGLKDEHAADPDACRRLLQEAEVSARLEHPGVVPVYGLVRDGDGRPYYAMRLVGGESLQQASDRFHQAEQPGRDPGERGLALRQLLAHFVAVCNTMAYAHSRGIVHRDLKPANVMLGKPGETLVVDWGLARPVERGPREREDGEDTLRPTVSAGAVQTQMGQAAGTPAYMSPEQAAGRWDVVGSASDIYSLGATLYCLLTGRAPMQGHNIAEILQKVQRGSFPRPREVCPAVPAALEAVCLKAMALEPGGRYATAQELAADVERWLGDEPVTAWREPWTTRARRWLKRHRTAVASASVGLVAVLLLTGALGLLLAAWERERSATSLAEQKREEALQNSRVALHTSDRFTELARRLKPLAGTQSRTVREILKTTRDTYGELLARAGTDPEVRAGKARMETIFSEVHLALNGSGRALDGVRGAVDVWNELLADDPTRAEWRAGLAESQQQLARVLDVRGDSTGALAAHEAALALRQKLAEEEPANQDRRSDLALSLSYVSGARKAVGDSAGHERLLRRALDVRTELAHSAPGNLQWQRNLAFSKARLADLLWTQNKNDEALALTEEARKLLRAALDAQPDNAEWQLDLASTSLSLGLLWAERRDAARAHEAYQECLTLWRGLTEQDPNDIRYLRGYLVGRMQALDVVTDSEQLTQARIVEVFRAQAANLRQDLARVEQLAREDPDNAECQGVRAFFREQLASFLTGLAALGEDRDANLEEALRLLEQAREIGERLVRLDPARVSWAEQLARTHTGGLSLVLQTQGRKADAARTKLKGLRQNRDLYERLVRLYPDDQQQQGRLAFTCLSIGLTVADLAHPGQASPEDLAQALEAFEAARKVYARLTTRAPDSIEWLEGLRRARLFTGRVLGAQGREDESFRIVDEIKPLEEKLARLRAAAPAPPDPGAGRRECSIRRIAFELGGSGEDQIAAEYRIVNRHEMSYFNNPSVAQALGLVESCERLGLRLLEIPTRETHAQAARLFHRGLSVLDALRRQKTLPKDREAQVAKLEGDLKGVFPGTDSGLLTGERARKRDALDYEALARELLAKHQARDLVRFVVEEDRQTDRLPAWKAALIWAVALEPEVFTPTVEAARALRAEVPDALGAEGRKVLARLAQFASQDKIAEEFAPDLREEWPSDLVTSLDLLLGRAGRTADRVRILAEAVRRSRAPDTGELRRLLAQAQVAAGQPEQAIETLHALEKLAPATVPDQLLLAEIYADQRRFVLAREVCRKVLELPKLSALYRGTAGHLLAAVLEEVGEFDQAEAELTTIIPLAGSTNLAETYKLQLALLRAERGRDLEQAEAQYRKVLEIYPAASKADLGWLLALRGQVKEGLSLMEKEKDQATGIDFFDKLGDVYRLDGQADKARASYQKALQLFPKTTDVADHHKKAIESKLAALK